jgi:hypothetical protein
VAIVVAGIAIVWCYGRGTVVCREGGCRRRQNKLEDGRRGWPLWCYGGGHSSYMMLSLTHCRSVHTVRVNCKY